MTEERHIWDVYKKSVKTAPKKKPKSVKAKSRIESAVERKENAAQNAKHHVMATLTKLVPALTDRAPQSLERKRERALRDGDLEIEGRLDLHGMTQVQAFDALSLFMHKKAKAGKRYLLIITGKGRDGDGVLRQNLRGWLGQLPEAGSVMALCPAAPRHGGDGAFYVVLRKKTASRSHD